MSPDLLGWLAEELELVLLEDGEDGRVQVVGSPSEAGVRDAASLPAAVQRLSGSAGDPEEIERLVRRAREGHRVGADLRGGDRTLGRLVAWPVAPGRARVMVVGERTNPEAVRRAAAAELAAGVTHEVANALTAIAGWTRMAASGQPLPERTKQALQVVQRSAREALGAARGLLRTMRDSGAPSIEPSHPDKTDVAQVVGQVLDTLRPELDEARIALEQEVARDIWASTPPSTLRLVVSNLVRNAFEALGGPGRIRVATRRRGDRFVLTVWDDGPGMSAETLSHVFDRYFTTKRSGTGLGLALVRDTVEEAGGRVEVQSRPGGGTRFDVWLPLAGAAALSLRPGPAGAVTSGVHPKPSLLELRVLVVDDDDAMRSMVRTALELQGAVVDSAQSSEQALAGDVVYDVALVDLALGSERGDVLIAELSRAGRARRTVLMTGSPDVELPADNGPDALLRKPFELDELQGALKAVLEPSSPEAGAAT